MSHPEKDAQSSAVFGFFFFRFTEIAGISSSPSSYGSFKPQLYPSTSRKAKSPLPEPYARGRRPDKSSTRQASTPQSSNRKISSNSWSVMSPIQRSPVLTVDSANFRFAVSIALMRSSKVPAEMKR